MKKYKNVLMSLGSYVIAFVWYLLFISSSSPLSQFVPYKSGDIMNTIVIIIYFLFIIIGIFFGFKSKTKEPSLPSNLVILVGLLSLLGSFLLYTFYLGWTV